MHIIFVCVLILWSGLAHSQTIGVHVYTAHAFNQHLQNVNPGLYYRTNEGWEVGAYRNSYDRPSIYVGKQFEIGPVSVLVGLATGYKGQCPIGCYALTPAVVPSVKWKALRLSAPNLQGIHISLEKEL